MGSRMNEERSPADVLLKAGLIHSIIPVWAPSFLVFPVHNIPHILLMLRTQVLVELRRKARFGQMAVTLQILGVGLSWLGVYVHGRFVTFAGALIALAGAALTLVGKDRLTSLDEKINEYARMQRTVVYEWLCIVLEIGPYSYGSTGARGNTKQSVLRSRNDLLGPTAVDGLSAWLSSPDGYISPTDWWYRIQQDVTYLARVNEQGEASRRNAGRIIDLSHGVLFLGLLFAVLLVVIFRVPDVLLATATLLIVLLVRAAHETALNILPSFGVTTPIGLSSTSSWRQFFERELSSITEIDLDAICDSRFLIPRALSQRAARALVQLS
jgi:hypothetical protein